MNCDKCGYAFNSTGSCPNGCDLIKYYDLNGNEIKPPEITYYCTACTEKDKELAEKDKEIAILKHDNDVMVSNCEGWKNERRKHKKRIAELEQFLKEFAQKAMLLDFQGNQLFTKEVTNDVKVEEK